MFSQWTKVKVRRDAFVILTNLIELITKIKGHKISISNKIGIIKTTHYVAKSTKNKYFIFPSRPINYWKNQCTYA